MPEDTVLNDRQSQIVDRVERLGFVTIEALAEEFRVSSQTVRREIIRLDELGLIQRFHGGAGRRGSGERLSHEVKRQREAGHKAEIGALMASRVQEGQSIFLDVGTTAEATAQALRSKKQLTVVTPSANVAQVLFDVPGLEIILTGGRVIGNDLSMAGPIAIAHVMKHRFDWAIIACSAIEDDGAVLDFDAEKIALKQAAMEVSRRQALIADSSKFTRSARLEIARLDSFDLLVTDAPPPVPLRSRIDAERVLLPGDL
jgi:DeoR family glycerol-3-phosphate regulon repressor